MKDLPTCNVIYPVDNPAQIKSATNNRGTFDPDNPDIEYSLNEHDARESWERSEENTGGQTELMQKVTVDVWNALVDRKQHERAENYGQWKQHIGEMAAAIVENTNTTMKAADIEKRLATIFEEYEAAGRGPSSAKGGDPSTRPAGVGGPAQDDKSGFGPGKRNSVAVAEEAVNKPLNVLQPRIRTCSNRDMHWLEKAQTVRGFVDQNSDGEPIR